ncbi:MAG: hypothetical protein AAGF12_37480 [Myxococcota bacterium]
MDVLFLNSSVFDIPSSRRVGAIVHDGAADLRLWPGPGADRDLNEAHGGDLRKALDNERTQLGVEQLDLQTVARVHPGRLHCDFLAWIATRPPEPGTERAPAPSATDLEAAVLRALEFVAERSVERVAFPAIGGGPEEVDAAERLAVIVRTAHRYEDACFAAGKAPVVEEVIVCEPRSRILSDAKRRVQRLAKTAAPPKSEVKEKPKKRTVRKARKPKKPTLDENDVITMRAKAIPYDRTHTYAVGDWLTHKKFGLGRVEATTNEGAMEILFEDGAQKKLIHGR